MVLGAGLGGFADGIVLHQIAQWHSMGSAILPPHTMDAMRRNMEWDGWFHAAMLVLCLGGVFMLWNGARRGTTPRTAPEMAGQMLFGWGLFNLIEGVVDHHLLNLHHVRDLPVHEPVLDWLFLGIGGIGLMLAGRLLMRPSAVRATDAPI